MQWLLMPIAIGAGMLMVVQSACNSMLEKVLDRPVLVGIISLSVGVGIMPVDRHRSRATGRLGRRNRTSAVVGMAGRGLRGNCTVIPAVRGTEAGRGHLYRSVRHRVDHCIGSL